MRYNFAYDNINDALPVMAHYLLVNGDEFSSRAGVTKELMHVGITLHKPWQREIVLPERKANVAAQIAETMWVLAGRNDIGWLSHYLPRAADFSDDGVTWRAGYGPRLRNYHGVDQLEYLADTMRNGPGSRQAVATIWDPTMDIFPGKDIACNNWLNFSSRKGYLDLHVGVRSNDLIWGWSGINVFEWSALQEIVAGLSGLMVGGLHFSTTSLHVYDRHWAKARELSGSRPVACKDSPRFDAPPTLQHVDDLIRNWFEMEGRIRTGQFLHQSEVEAFPEQMMRSWLRVLQWYWSGDESFLRPIVDTRLYHAALLGVKPAGVPQSTTDKLHQAVREVPCKGGLHTMTSATTCVCGATQKVLAQPKPSFLEFANNLHHEKHAAYGDSWKRRGEPGILANIARKVDRLDAGSSTADETPFDTALDLLIYLAKYRWWLLGEEGGPRDVGELLEELAHELRSTAWEPDPDRIVEAFSYLETGELEKYQKISLVDSMLDQAYLLAIRRY